VLVIVPRKVLKDTMWLVFVFRQRTIVLVLVVTMTAFALEGVDSVKVV